MFDKSNGAKVRHLIERLSRKEQSVISDIQREIQEQKKKEQELEQQLADIQESYSLLLDAIDVHMEKWSELEELKEKALVIITE